MPTELLASTFAALLPVLVAPAAPELVVVPFPLVVTVLFDAVDCVAGACELNAIRLDVKRLRAATWFSMLPLSSYVFSYQWAPQRFEEPPVQVFAAAVAEPCSSGRIFDEV